jgi:HIV Tat-specific factor 1
LEKSKAESVMEKHLEKQKRARESAEAQAAWFDLKKNTSVYITGLPDDATEAEIAQVGAADCQSAFCAYPRGQI